MGYIKGYGRCMRVLTMSRGWTTRVEMVPALRPAMDSTRAGEMPALLFWGMKPCRGAFYMVVVLLSGGGGSIEMDEAIFNFWAFLDARAHVTSRLMTIIMINYKKL